MAGIKAADIVTMHHLCKAHEDQEKLIERFGLLRIIGCTEDGIPMVASYGEGKWRPGIGRE